MSAQKGINGGGAAGASTMGGADACRSALAAPEAIRARKAPGRTRTATRRDDDTTLPRMSGDAGLLMSTTTSEAESCDVT